MSTKQREVPSVKRIILARLQSLTNTEATKEFNNIFSSKLEDLSKNNSGIILGLEFVQAFGESLRYITDKTAFDEVVGNFRHYPRYLYWEDNQQSKGLWTEHCKSLFFSSVQEGKYGFLDVPKNELKLTDETTRSGELEIVSSEAQKDVDSNVYTRSEINNMTVKELRDVAKSENVSLENTSRKAAIKKMISNVLTERNVIIEA